MNTQCATLETNEPQYLARLVHRFFNIVIVPGQLKLLWLTSLWKLDYEHFWSRSKSVDTAQTWLQPISYGESYATNLYRD